MSKAWLKMASPVAAAAVVLAVAGCKAKVIFPDTLPGWHDAGYSSVFGRLQRIPAKNPENSPVWVVRFGLASDPYRGEFAIMPPERLVGYSGGELVEIRGAIRPELSYPTYVGTWYEAQSIHMWTNHR